jgi:curved DNA-binding protein CbpA
MKGNLSRGVLPGLLRELFVAHRTGLLHVARGPERRSVRFQDGRIVGAQASDPDEQMGPVLVRQGFLSQADLDRARDVMSSEQKRLGRALRDTGVWDEARKEEGLALHAREVLLRLFSWTEGEYVFEDLPAEADAAADDTTRKLSTGQLILDAARRVEDYPVVHAALGDLDRVLVLPADALLRFQNMMLTPADGYVLSRVDGEMTAREVLQVTPFPPEEAEKSLFCLLCTGALEYQPEAAPPPRPAPPPRREPPPKPAATGPPPSSIPPAPEAARRGLSARRREVIDKFAGLKTKNHFEVLEIDPDAGPDKVKDAYFRLAKRFHPDSHHREVVLEDIKDKLEAIFIRLGEAHDVLRNPRARASYESTLKGRGRAAAVPVTAAGPGPVMMDPAEQLQRDTAALRKAEKLVEQEKYWDVIQMLEGVVPRLTGKLRQRARMALGRAYLKNPNWVKEGEELVRQVVAEDPQHAAAHLLLGQLYKERGLKARAVSMLRKAVELEPENAQASADLDALAGDVAVPVQESGGLLKKLFGRS